MLIVEIVVSGLKGLPASLRVAPLSGVNVFPAVSPERRRRFLDALFHTLHADAAGRERLAWLVDPAQPSSRLAIAVRAKDGQIYRLLRDFGTGGAQLHRKQGEGSDWTALSSDVAEVAQFARVQLRLPPFAAYERLYVLAPDKLVGKGAGAESRSGGPLWPQPALGRGGSVGGGGLSGGLGGNLGYGAAGGPQLRMPSALGPAASFGQPEYSVALDPSPAFVTSDLSAASPLIPRATSFARAPSALFQQAAEAPRATYDVEAARREHARLSRHVELLRRSRQMRVELDQLSQRRERLRAAVVEVQAAFDVLDQARADAEQFKHLEGLPPGIADRIRDMDGAASRREKELARIEEEREEAERARERAQPKPLPQDPVFVGGLLVWLLAIVIAALVGSAPVALLNIVGAALAAVAALSHLAALERGARLGVRLAAIDEKAARYDKQYELETGVARKLLQQLDADPNELLQQLEAAAEASAARAAAEHRAAALESDPARRREIAELASVEARIDELEGQLLSVEGSEAGSANGEELERRLAQLTRELAERGPAVAPTSSAGLGGRDDVSQRVRARAPGDDDERLVSGDQGALDVLWAPGAFEDGEAREASGLGGGGPIGPGAGGYGGEGPPPTDGTAALGAALSDVVHRPIEILGPALLPRLSQYLRAFTGGAYVGAEVGVTGEIRVKPEGADGTAPVSVVEPLHARAVEAAIHLAWLEAAVSRVAVPVLVDDPFVGVPAPVRKLIGKALGYVGERAQVIVLTPEDDLQGHVLGR